MIQTPHTLHIGIDLAGDMVELAWRQPPLRGDGPDGHSLPRRVDSGSKGPFRVVNSDQHS
jgi:hypothetical protein